MSRRLIFVSCGQRSPEERRVGQQVKSLIEATDGFEAYFADNVHDLGGLGEHIFDALRRCTGAVVFLQPRGTVTGDDGVPLGVRSSVWVNQEVALLAYRQFFEGHRIPILAFSAESVQLEGAMTAFIINPQPLRDESAMLDTVRQWLASDARVGPSDNQAAFETKWNELQPYDHHILRGIIREGGHQIKKQSLDQHLRPHVREGVTEVILANRLQRMATLNLVQITHNIYDGDEVSLHPAWQWQIRHALATLDGS